MHDELTSRVELQLQLEPQSTATPGRSEGVAHEESSASLLALPDPILLAVLQCLDADNDQRSLFSCARAHSRLHQAAVQACSSISVQDIEHKQQVDGVLLYLSKHGRHLSRVSLGSEVVRNMEIRELHTSLQLDSLQLHDLHLQLLPGNGWQGLLGCDGVSALKQLQVNRCVLLDGEEGLQATLALLSRLEHLSLDTVYIGHENLQHSYVDGYFRSNAEWAQLPTTVLQQLTDLTHLEMSGIRVQGPGLGRPILQPLQALTRLVDMRLIVSECDGDGMTPRLLPVVSGMHGLTRLVACFYHVEAGALAGKPGLQHLHLKCCTLAPNHAAWLAQLRDLQQVTHLDLSSSMEGYDPTSPAAAYAALTSSSKLQHLGLWRTTLPVGAWEHMFAADRQLPHLTSLDISNCWQPPSAPDAFGCGFATAPDGSRLVSCCPGLKHLNLLFLEVNSELLAPLTGLIDLHTLRIAADDSDSRGGLGVVWQLTGLRELELFARAGPDFQESRIGATKGLLMQLAQLKQLTKLIYIGNTTTLKLSAQGPGDKPVWRQVLMRHLRHRNPAIVQQAIRALAE